MNDYLSLIPSTLEWVSKRLDSVSPIPWPLWIGLLFPLYLGIVFISVWILRGRVWPVRCAYAKTSRNRPCQEWVPGEWYRCRHHNSRRSYKYGHTVLVELKRWQRVTRGGQVLDSEFHSPGLLRTRPRGATLLYHNGFSRDPVDVLHLVPSFIKRIWERARAMRLGVKREPVAASVTEEASEIDGAAGVEYIAHATRFCLIAVLLGLTLSGVALLTDGGWKAAIQWIATLAIVCAWAGTSAGIYQRQEQWLRGAVAKSAKWWIGIFAPVAFINLVFTWIN